MKRILILAFVVSAFAFGGCKKCQQCGPVSIDGHEQTIKVCDKEEIKHYETLTNCR